VTSPWGNIKNKLSKKKQAVVVEETRKVEPQPQKTSLKQAKVSRFKKQKPEPQTLPDAIQEQQQSVPEDMEVLETYPINPPLQPNRHCP